MPKTFTGKKYFSRNVKKILVSSTTQLQVETAIVETKLSNICLRGYIPVSSGLCLLGSLCVLAHRVRVSMEEKHYFEITPKLRIFTPENAYNHKIWTFYPSILAWLICKMMKNKNTLAGEISQYCRGVSYILTKATCF
jgi:hypothetical protein